MATVDFDAVVAQVKALTPAEQLRLRELLDAWLAPPPAPAGEPLTDEEFEQELAREGVISVPPPITDFTPYQNRRPIEIKGKPLSETIIEERR